MPAPRDKHSLPQEPGAHVAAGTAGKEKKISRATFRASVGHGAAGGGAERGGSASGDPTITYKNALTWARSLGKTGKFSTKAHEGKMPINYDEDMSSYMLEY